MEFVSAELSVCYCHLFLDLPLVMSDSGLVWPEAACSKLQAIRSLWLCPSGLAGPHCSVLPAFHQNKAQEWFIRCPRAMPVPPPPFCTGSLQCDWEDGIPGSPRGGAIQSSGKMVGMFPCPLSTTRLGMSQIIYNNV